LIRYNKYSIDDLPVLEITSQFLAYVRRARDLDTDLGGEFMEVASWLVLLKSRSLLPSGRSEGPSPREELRRAVLDHATLEAATTYLRGRNKGPRKGNAPAAAGIDEAEPEPVSDDRPTVQEVLAATMQAVAAARAAQSFESTLRHEVTIQDIMVELGTKFATLQPRTAVSTARWFSEQPSIRARASLLLVLLELAREGVLLLHQEEDFATIRVKLIREVPANIQVSALEYESISVPNS
jgi:segregation and condensation protein A